MQQAHVYMFNNVCYATYVQFVNLCAPFYLNANQSCRPNHANVMVFHQERNCYCSRKFDVFAVQWKSLIDLCLLS